MNKTNKMLFLLPLFLILAVGTVLAYPTIINGNSYASDGRTKAPYTPVIVFCNGNFQFVTSNSVGFYVTTYAEGLCPENSTAYAGVWGKMSSAVVKKSRVLPYNMAYINFALPPVELPTLVSGHAYAQGTSTPVPNIAVSVTCNGNQLQTTTNADGFYVVEFTAGQCPVGANACAGGVGSQPSCTTVTKSNVINKNIAYINFEVYVPPVPGTNPGTIPGTIPGTAP